MPAGVEALASSALAAENAWRQFSDETGVPVAIIRLAGIYGPGRGPFEKIRRGTARRIVKPGQVFNRIHVDDIAAIVEAAFERRADGIFNGSDDEPAPPRGRARLCGELLGLPPPPEVAFEEAELTPMARSFYGESKRVRNDRIKRELGVRLPTRPIAKGLRGDPRRRSAHCELAQRGSMRLSQSCREIRQKSRDGQRDPIRRVFWSSRRPSTVRASWSSASARVGTPAARSRRMRRASRSAPGLRHREPHRGDARLRLPR